MKTMLVLIASILLQDPNTRIRILKTGAYHQDEVSLTDGGQWYALVGKESDFSLTPVEVSINRVHDPIDEDETSLNGREVVADTRPDPLLLLRGRAFRTGNIHTMTSAPVTIGLGKPVKAGSAEFSLLVQDSSMSQGQHQYTMSLRLRIGPVDQFVASYTGYRDSGTEIIPAAEVFPELLWSGDLDGDEQMDFLLNTSDHYNVEEVTLFLSSHTPKGSLVTPAAKVRRVGC